jgi:secretion/DNA translocation related TadE-like protein
MRWWQSQRGAGTVMSLAVLSISVGLFGATQIVAQRLYQLERLQMLADEVALTAVDALRGLTIGYPCELARQIAQENMVKLDECRIVGFEAFISLRSDVVGIVLIANARAGPS